MEAPWRSLRCTQQRRHPSRISSRPLPIFSLCVLHIGPTRHCTVLHPHSHTSNVDHLQSLQKVASLAKHYRTWDFLQALINY